MTNNAGKKLTEITDSLERLQAVTEFFNANYPDAWSLVETGICKEATDSLELVIRCDNRNGDAILRCSHTKTIGVSLNSEFKEYYSETQTDYQNLQLIFMKMELSQTTGFNWGLASSSIYDKETSTSVQIEVPPGAVTDVMEVVGFCGAYTIRTSDYSFRTYEGDEEVPLITKQGNFDGQQRKVLFALNGQFSFSRAISNCQKVNGANLGTMRNDFDYNAAVQMMGAWNSHRLTRNHIFGYIGAKRNVEGGDFFWITDGTLASYANGRPAPTGEDKTYWADSQPDRSDELLIGLAPVGERELRWHDLNDETLTGALCEFLF